MGDIYDKIINLSDKKQVALLLDPDKQDMVNLERVLAMANQSPVTMILIGGSLVNSDINAYVQKVKSATDLPVVLFPGSSYQFTSNADAILLLSLISGRNSEFLIGNHVQVAFRLKQSGMEIIPTGYILIDGGGSTSVQYMSNTLPIPASKPEIAVATALAGEQLGLKLIYLEAGSGAQNSVPVELISMVKSEISIPLIVGGGLRTASQVNDAFNAGANLVVLGNGVEVNPEILLQIKK